MGNLGQDPELKSTQSGDNVCSFSIATNESWNDANGVKQERVTWHNCTAWRKTGENINQFFKRGSKILIEGKLNIDEWQTDTGEKRKAAKIVVDKFYFVDSKSDDNQPAPAQQQAQPVQQYQPAQPVQQQALPVQGQPVQQQGQPIQQQYQPAPAQQQTVQQQQQYQEAQKVFGVSPEDLG